MEKEVERDVGFNRAVRLVESAKGSIETKEGLKMAKMNLKLI
jgi:hypothetical protein